VVIIWFFNSSFILKAASGLHHLIGNHWHVLVGEIAVGQAVILTLTG
jgi:hypothetical protein